MSKESFSFRFPYLLNYFDFDNNVLDPNDVSYGSAQKASWRCLDYADHTWISSFWEVSHVNGRTPCPYCRFFEVLPGFNDVETLNPDLMKYWDANLNGPAQHSLSIDDRVFWWLCPNESHSFPKSLGKRKHYPDCIYCTGKAVITGFNDLMNRRAELMPYWDFKRNSQKPDEILFSTTKMFYWWCMDCGTTFKKAPRGMNEPKCKDCILEIYSHKNRQTRVMKRIKSKTTLVDVYPEILSQWDYTKNNTNPESYAPKSNHRVWWRCSNGHSYRTAISNRTNLETGCPECWSKIFVSKGETEIAQFLQQQSLHVKTTQRILPHNREIDIIVPSLRIGIEYNGDYWHSEKVFQLNPIKPFTSKKEMHLWKIEESLKLGINLIHVWEHDWTHHKALIKEALFKVIRIGSSPSIFKRTSSVLDEQCIICE